MTNQVSEDKLIKSKTDWSTPYDEWLLPTLNRFRYGGAIECRAIPSEIQLNIESLIRTEKQKLLAEVRERVVGEDKPLQGKYRASGLMSYDMTNHYENSLRAEQRAVLTQLEAEL